jgi:LysR family transcriptional regulator for metE and metH
VDLRLVVGNRHMIFSRLADYELDIAVAGTPPAAFEVESQEIGPHPIVLIGPPDHPLAMRRDLTLADFADETVLLREQGSGTRALMERLFENAGVDNRRRLEMGSNETIKQAVIGGLGIALISAHTVSAEIRDSRMVAFAVAGLPAMRTWFVMKRRDKRLFPAAAALWRFLAARGAEFLPDTRHVTGDGDDGPGGAAET